MTWRAIIPLKQAGARKTRLAARLSAAERDRLCLEMFAHVARTLAACPAIGGVCVLSPVRPDGWSGAWLRDAGRGLNAELAGARERLGGARVLVIHADLPWLAREDVAAMVEAAEAAGAALAPDHHDQGTNAVGLRDETAFDFRFGPGSLGLHRVQRPGAAIVRRDGLARDVDTPEDLEPLARGLMGRAPLPA
jgi:2-phospho-L-lactate guanylyltransferase